MNLENEGRKPENQEKLPGNVEIVRTDAGTFRIIYGIHIIPSSAEDLGRRYGGVVLEDMAPAKVTEDELSNERVAFLYEHVLHKAADEQKPVFIVDTTSTGEEGLYMFLDVLAAGTAFATARAAFKNEREEATTRRRAFLKKMTGVAAAGYLTTVGLATIVSGATAFLGAQNTSRIASKVLETTTPGEPYIRTLRNLIAAEKMEKVVKKYPADFKDKELAAVYGAGHTGLADALQMGHEARMQKIKSLGNTWPYRRTTGRGFARILRFDFDKTKGAWKIQEEFDEDIERAIH